MLEKLHGSWNALRMTVTGMPDQNGWVQGALRRTPTFREQRNVGLAASRQREIYERHNHVHLQQLRRESPDRHLQASFSKGRGFGVFLRLSWIQLTRRSKRNGPSFLISRTRSCPPVLIYLTRSHNERRCVMAVGPLVAAAPISSNKNIRTTLLTNMEFRKSGAPAATAVGCVCLPGIPRRI